MKGGRTSACGAEQKDASGRLTGVKRGHSGRGTGWEAARCACSLPSPRQPQPLGAGKASCAAPTWQAAGHARPRRRALEEVGRRRRPRHAAALGRQRAAAAQRRQAQPRGGRAAVAGPAAAAAMVVPDVRMAMVRVVRQVGVVVRRVVVVRPRRLGSGAGIIPQSIGQSVACGGRAGSKCRVMRLARRGVQTTIGSARRAAKKGRAPASRAGGALGGAAGLRRGLWPAHRCCRGRSRRPQSWSPRGCRSHCLRSMQHSVHVGARAESAQAGAADGGGSAPNLPRRAAGRACSQPGRVGRGQQGQRRHVGLSARTHR